MNWISLLFVVFVSLQQIASVACSSITLYQGCTDCVVSCASASTSSFVSGSCTSTSVSVAGVSIPIAYKITCASPNNSSSAWVASVYAASSTCSAPTTIFAGTGAFGCSGSNVLGQAVSVKVDCGGTTPTITPTTTPSITPSTAPPAPAPTLPPFGIGGRWMKASLTGSSCDYECNATGRYCFEPAFSAINSTNAMLAIAAQANFNCPAIAPGNLLLHEDPEFDGYSCFYGGGVGKCSSLGDVNNYRFCPCAVRPTPTPTPTITPTTTPSPTTSPTPTPTSTSIILQSYEFSFSFFEVKFTSMPFRVTSSLQHADALVPALAQMNGVRFHLLTNSTTDVTFSVCDVASGKCTIQDQLACSNTAHSTDSDISVPACASVLFIPLQQTNVMLRVKAGNQAFAFSVYEQMVR